MSAQRPSWNEAWLNFAVIIGQRSRCDAKIGAVIVGPGNRYVQPGYAGPPAHYAGAEILSDTKPCAVYCARAGKPLEQRDQLYRDCPSVHAEANALILADRSQYETGTFYVTGVPCWSCAKMIANSGVYRCVFIHDAEADATGRDPKKIRGFLEYCSLSVVVYPENFAAKRAELGIDDS